MKANFVAYDTANYLFDDKEIAAYLAACASENDPALMTHALGVVARARNMSELARNVGLTRAGLYRALSTDGNPSFATISKVADALGFHLSFQPKGAVKPSAKRSRPKAASKRTTRVVVSAVSAKRRQPSPSPGKRSLSD